MFSIFMCVLAAIVAGIITAVASADANGKANNSMVVGISMLVLVIAIGVAGVRVVAPGYAGVEVIFGSVVSQPLGNGLHLVVPWATIVRYDTRVKLITMSQSTKATISAPSKDALSMDVDVTVKVRPKVEKLPWVHENWGPEYVKKLEATIRQSVRDTVSHYEAMAAYSYNREEVGIEMMEKIKVDVKEEIGDAIEIIAFNLRSIMPPQLVTKAIDEKLAMKQVVEKKEAERQIAEKDAQIAVIEAEGLAEAQSIINKTLTPTYIEFKRLETLRQFADSENNTIIITPAGTNTAGTPPIILNVP